MATLNSIANRLTPSVPMQITFGAQPVATGNKITTLFGHMLASPGTGVPYQVYSVVNVGDPVAAKNEVDALAGVDSQIGLMAEAFVNANAAKTGSTNFPAFRVVLIPSNRSDFGPNEEATEAVKGLRSDMFVSCYAASDSANRGKLLALCQLISGIDRDLQGQFGSFMTVGSLDALATAVAYAINSPMVEVAYLPDSNTATVPFHADTEDGSAVLSAASRVALTPTGDTTSGSAVISAMSSVANIYPGALITGTGIPAGAIVEKVLTVNSVQISAVATSSNTAEALSIVNTPATVGIYPGAVVSGTGIPVGAKVVSVDRTSVTLDQEATADGTSVALSALNMVSQPAEIVAAAHAGAQMASAVPYNPLQGVVIGGLIPPRKSSDWIQIDPAGSSEAALIGGLSPLFVQPGGTVAFVRTRTTWVLKSDAVTPITAYFDWQELVALNDYREAIYQVSQNPPFNNNPGGTKASQQIADKFKDEGIRVAVQFEEAGMFENVQLLSKFFQCVPSASNRGRFDFKYPVEVLPGLMVLAGNIEAVSDLGAFTV